MKQLSNLDVRRLIVYGKKYFDTNNNMMEGTINNIELNSRYSDYIESFVFLIILH